MVPLDAGGLKTTKAARDKTVVGIGCAVGHSHVVLTFTSSVYVQVKYLPLSGLSSVVIRRPWLPVTTAYLLALMFILGFFGWFVGGLTGASVRQGDFLWSFAAFGALAGGWIVGVVLEVQHGTQEVIFHFKHGGSVKLRVWLWASQRRQLERDLEHLMRTPGGGAA